MVNVSSHENVCRLWLLGAALFAASNAAALYIRFPFNVGVPVVLAVLWGLKHLDNARSPEQLVRYLDNPFPPIRRWAVRRLAHVAQRSQIRTMAEHAVWEPDADIQEALVDALGDLRFAEAAPYLTQLVTAPDRVRVRYAAIRALGKIRDPRMLDGIEAAFLELELGECLPDRINIAHALRQFTTPAAAATLSRLLKRESDVTVRGELEHALAAVTASLECREHHSVENSRGLLASNETVTF